MQDLTILNDSYLIIGGPKSKKSDVARLLSKTLKYKLINLGREKYGYFDDFTDYDFKTYQNIKDKYGELKALNYIHKYEMKHLNYVLENIDKNVVIDFGSTYTLLDDEVLLNKIKMFKNIVLLESSKELDKFDNKLRNNKINKMIATITINTDKKDEESIVQEILNFKEFKSML